eukprot:TRINITY_DN30864_c0_g1_i1.p2 TRINITY_DN30864_c0_g1~~TRINITY_DN30864_c0_g1_i1.p2  ORF type:complete len:161 (-),score=38.90 TRINITY_DN30864_c0_g1_i1:104-586(-)
MAGEDELTRLNDKLAGSREARGARGGLGRKRDGQTSGALSAWEKGVAAFKRPKYEPAGEDPLYKRFARGPVLGGSAGEEAEEAATWRAHVEAALRDAGGELSWKRLREEVVERHRRKVKKEGKISGKKEDEDESLWPTLALAHVPAAFLSNSDSIVRLKR